MYAHTQRYTLMHMCIHKCRPPPTHTHFVSESPVRAKRAEKEGEKPIIVGYFFNLFFTSKHCRGNCDVFGGSQESTWERGFIEHEGKPQHVSPQHPLHVCFTYGPFFCWLWECPLKPHNLKSSNHFFFGFNYWLWENAKDKHNSKEAETFRLSLSQSKKLISAILNIFYS